MTFRQNRNSRGFVFFFSPATGYRYGHLAHLPLAHVAVEHRGLLEHGTQVGYVAHLPLDHVAIERLHAVEHLTRETDADTLR